MLSAFPALAELLRWLLFRASDAFVIGMIVGGALVSLVALELEFRSSESRAMIRTRSRDRLSNACALVFLCAIPAWWLAAALPFRPAIRDALHDVFYVLVPVIGSRLVFAWVHDRWRVTRHPSVGIDPPAT